MNLQQAGYDVQAVADGQAALDSQAGEASDLLVLDLMMPRLDGLEVCKALRARGRDTPILMLTAKSTELDRVLGLELGADDYLTKPFSMAELLARVKALLRRADLLQAARAGAPADRACCATASWRSGRPSAAWRCAAQPWSSRRWSSTCCCTSRSTRAACSRARSCSTPCGATPTTATNTP